MNQEQLARESVARYVWPDSELSIRLARAVVALARAVDAGADDLTQQHLGLALRELRLMPRQPSPLAVLRVQLRERIALASPVHEDGRAGTDPPQRTRSSRKANSRTKKSTS